MNISLNRIAILVMINLLFQANRCQDLPNFPENKTRRVYGGRPVALGEIPYQVGFKTRSISDPKRYYTFCGGVIIGEAKILSAAHCFVGESRNTSCPGITTFPKSLHDKYAVAATIRNFLYFEEEEYEQWRTLRNLTYPHNYNFPEHDLAVLFVMEPFEFNHLVKPIRMADRFIDYEGLGLVSGYGEISHAVTSDSLLAANLLLFPSKLCSGFHPKIDMTLSICTSLVGTEIGRGDSGGPLVYTHAVDLEGKDDKTLIGIASGTYVGQNSIFLALPLLSIEDPSAANNNKSYSYADNYFAMYDQWTPRVVNGWPAKLGDVPYQIALKSLVHRASSQYQTFCGATIIGEIKLLTAAHCFEEKLLSNCNKILHPGKSSKRSLRHKYAVAGNLYNTARYQPDGPGGQWRALKSVQFPKKYRFPRDDIAVIILTSSFNYNPYINSIPMAIQYKDYVGKCLVSGYGRTGEKAHERSMVLLLTHLTLIPNRRCSQLHRKPMDFFVCTSSLFTDVGKGDSGGPLVCSKTGDPNEKDKGVLVGVVSGNLRHRGSFFTRVSSYRQFIAGVNSVSTTMYKYNMQSCTAVTVCLIYKTFVPF